MKIYLDIFFLVNACMNFIILTAICMFRKRRIRLRRLLAASSAGAAAAAGILICGIHTYKILFALLYLPGICVLVGIAFGKTTVPAFLANLAAYFVMSCLLAALLMQMQGFVGASGKLSLLLLSGALFLGALYAGLPYFHKKREESGRYYRVSVVYQGRSIRGTALLDTGNELTEPFSGEPVCVADKVFFDRFFANGEKPVFRQIPFHSIGREAGVIPAFRADELVIACPGRQKVTRMRPWIAAAEGVVSVNGEYELILHPDLLADRMGG